MAFFSVRAKHSEVTRTKEVVTVVTRVDPNYLSRQQRQLEALREQANALHHIATTTWRKHQGSHERFHALVNHLFADIGRAEEMLRQLRTAQLINPAEQIERLDEKLASIRQQTDRGLAE